MTEEQIKGISSIVGLIGAIVILIWTFISTNSNSEEDFAGTYKVHKKEGYITPAFNLILNEDGSVRVDVGADGDDDSYGSWKYYSYNGDHAAFYMDDNFKFVFGFSMPVLDLETNRLYVSSSAFEQKHPNKYFKVTKIK